MQANNHKFITSLIVGTMVSSTIFAVNPTPIKAQSGTPLLRAKCVSSGEGSVRQKKQDVSIGRAVYTSLFFLGSGYRSAAMTCKIKPDSRPQPIFQTLNLGFGMRDNDADSPTVQVNIFVDGQQVETRSVAPTQKQTLALDVSQASNIAIETTCTSGVRYCDRVYFFTANLERIRNQTNVNNPVEKTESESEVEQ